MSPRWRPPHPARTIPAPPPCPAGDRFASRALAQQALLGSNAPIHLTPTRCSLGCGGWHITGEQR